MRAGFPFAPRRYIMDAWKSIANGKADGIPAGGAAPRRAARRTSPTGRTARRRAIARAPSSISERRAALRRRWWCCSCWWRCTRSLAAGRTARPPRRRPYRRLPRTAALPARRAARGRTARSTSIFSTWARPTARSSRRRTVDHAHRRGQPRRLPDHRRFSQITGCGAARRGRGHAHARRPHRQHGGGDRQLRHRRLLHAGPAGREQRLRGHDGRARGQRRARGHGKAPAHGYGADAGGLGRGRGDGHPLPV